jgi:hypothetical protein
MDVSRVVVRYPLETSVQASSATQSAPYSMQTFGYFTATKQNLIDQFLSLAKIKNQWSYAFTPAQP